MNQKSKNFCFCTLAFNPPYRKMSKDLARDLEKYAPGIRIVIGTDEVKDFKDCPNVISYHQKQQGILHCYNDKRFVFEFVQQVGPLPGDERKTRSLGSLISLTPFFWYHTKGPLDSSGSYFM